LGTHLRDPLALVTASDLDRRFLVVGAELTGHHGTVVWLD
jgi:hypothetical protein